MSEMSDQPAENNRKATEKPIPIHPKTGKPMPVGRNWQPGQSGNPGGRPRVVADIRALAQLEGAACIETLIEIRDDKKASPVARSAAAQALLDRGYGRAIQRQEHTGADGGPIQTQQIADDRVPVDAFLSEFATAKRDEAKH